METYGRERADERGWVDGEAPIVRPSRPVAERPVSPRGLPDDLRISEEDLIAAGVMPLAEEGRQQLQEKAAVKEEMESEIARLSEVVRIAEDESQSFNEQIEALKSKIGSDQGTDPKLTGERIKALREYEGFKNDVEMKLLQSKDRLKKLQARYNTVFGAPLAH